MCMQLARKHESSRGPVTRGREAIEVGLGRRGRAKVTERVALESEGGGGEGEM